MNNQVIYIKSRPQGCDVWPIAREHKRVFLGYPVQVSDGSARDWRSKGCQAVFRDISDTWNDAWTDGLTRGYKSRVTGNRNLLKEIGAGSIVLVPRPSDGVVHAGRIAGQFELVDRPVWADDYFDLRRDLKLKVDDESEHIGDVCQSLQVDRWVELPFFSIPRWITYRLLSRNSIGLIRDIEQSELFAWETVSRIIDDPLASRPKGKLEIEQGLLSWTSPAVFEHLVVSLLQLENTEGLYWHHVGGSGDGGVDGIAIDSNGKQRGAVQCKWLCNSAPEELFDSFGNAECETKIVALLHGTEPGGAQLPKGQLIWDRREIADLVDKHRANLPFAYSLGLSSNKP